MLSKDHGFVQAFELYYFPYRVPDSTTYEFPEEYDLLFSEANYDGINGIPNQHGLKDFNLVDFHYPMKSEIFNYNVGDRTHFHYNYTTANFEEYRNDEVTNKITVAGTFQYKIHRTTEKYTKVVVNNPYPHQETVYNFYEGEYDLIADSTIPLSFYFPETQYSTPGDTYTTYYSPNDSSHCLHSPLYRIGTFKHVGGWLGSQGQEIIYKIGIGETYKYNHTGGGPFVIWSDTLIYSDLSNTLCGTPKWPDNIQHVNSENQINIYPNPVGDVLSIDFDNKDNRNYSLSLTDIMGKTITAVNTTKATIDITVAHIPAGIYNLKIQSENNVLNRKVLISH
jgi:hypothetical protein